MALTVEKVTLDALGLPCAERVELVEKILASLAGEFTASVERTHLDEIRRRRESVRAGQSQLIDGDEALRHARAALRQ